MNIIFFMQDTGTVFGAERATLDIARALRDDGFSPYFFLMVEARLSGESGLQQAIKQSGFPLHTFPVSGRFSMPTARAVKKAYSDISGDVLHVIGYKANLHAWLSGIRPVVATVHGWLFRRDLKERTYDAIDRWCLKRCDGVICLSTYYRDLLLKAGVKEGRLKLIPSGLEAIPSADEIERTYAPREHPVFGMMGRFSEEKNHALFLSAAAELYRNCPDVRFRIAGQGPLEDQVKSRCKELGLSEAVEFCGYMDVATFMTSIDVYVICSKIENLPYSILEAMAWSRPVIGTRVGGIPDLVEDGQTGYLVSPDSCSELIDAMKRLVTDSTRVRQFGEAGRERMLASFTLEKSSKLHQDMYRSLTT